MGDVDVQQKTTSGSADTLEEATKCLETTSQSLDVVHVRMAAVNGMVPILAY